MMIQQSASPATALESKCYWAHNRTPLGMRAPRRQAIFLRNPALLDGFIKDGHIGEDAIAHRPPGIALGEAAPDRQLRKWSP